MKKTALVLLILFVLVASCFASGSSEATAVPATSKKFGDEPVEIVFWHCSSDEAGQLVEKYIRNFNETNQYKITVKAIFQGQYSDATTLMKTILSAENYKELPDIMQLDATGKVDYYNSGKAFTIDDAQKFFGENILDQYVEGAYGNWQFSGAQLGLPFATSTTITFYNKDLLKKAGWNHCPETFEEITQLAADMRKAGLSAAAFGTVPNTPLLANWIGQLGSYVLDYSNGADASATKLVCLENGSMKTFMTAWKNMYDNGGVQNRSLGTNQFVNQEVAIMTTSSSNITSLMSKVGGAFEVGTAPFVRVNAQATYGATTSGACLAMFDSGDVLKKAATWEFIKYMTGEEVQADFAAGTGYSPGNKKAAENPVYVEYLKSIPQASIVSEQLEKTPAFMRSITVGPSADFYYGIMNGFTDMLTKNLSVDDAMKAMTGNLQSLLDNYHRSNP